MGSTRPLARDLADLLRCPGCHSAGLQEEAGAVRCPHCETAYPVEPGSGVCALVTAASREDGVKQDIQAWWGDLYQQIYARHETELDAAGLDRALDQLEDLFRCREHLAVVEMPLAELAGLRVLEIGPGAGGHSALFQKHGASVTAVDITPQRALSTARKLDMVTAGDGRAYQADAENLPFSEGCFDIVYSNGVLHHSSDTDRCIAEVHRVLKPGGRAVIMLYSRHSAVYWLNVVPRALFSGEMFRWPEAQWIGRLTEGKPKFGETRNPITRVYSERQMRRAFAAFHIDSLRKTSFQFDNICVPRMTQVRNAVLRAFGVTPHPGGYLVYGADFLPETRLELRLGSLFGFAWNIVAEKSE